MDKKRESLVVKGRVQGVGFRFFTVDIAQSAGLTGWVRNTFDGNVEIEAQGTPEQLQTFFSQLREGPPLSHVRDIKVREMPVRDDEKGFVIRY